MQTPEEYKNKYFGGNKQSTEENLDYSIMKLKEMNKAESKLTFRQWLTRMMNLIDLID